jgi:hypothetical protein
LSVGPVTGALGDLGSWLQDRAEFWRTLTGEADPPEDSDLRPAYEFRDVDDFVGGVHLSTSQDRVWLRTSDGLALWHRAA